MQKNCQPRMCECLYELQYCAIGGYSGHLNSPITHGSPLLAKISSECHIFHNMTIAFPFCLHKLDCLSLNTMNNSLSLSLLLFLVHVLIICFIHFGKNRYSRFTIHTYDLHTLDFASLKLFA